MASDGEGGTGLGLGRSKGGSVLLLGCHAVDSADGWVGYDDFGLDIEDLNIEVVELFFLCLTGSLAVSGSVTAAVWLTAKEAWVAFREVGAGVSLETINGILDMNSLAGLNP